MKDLKDFYEDSWPGMTKYHRSEAPGFAVDLLDQLRKWQARRREKRIAEHEAARSKYRKALEDRKKREGLPCWTCDRRYPIATGEDICELTGEIITGPEMVFRKCPKMDVMENNNV